MQKGSARRSPDEGQRSFWLLGELLTCMVPSRQTGGAYSLFEVVTPSGAGPPAHVQHREDEAFYVLEGEYEFLIGEETKRAGPGSLFYVRKGTLHAHQNVGEGTGRMLMSQTPDGLYEFFFEGSGIPADDGAGLPAFRDLPHAAGIRAVAAEYGIEIPAPVARRTRTGAGREGPLMWPTRRGR